MAEYILLRNGQKGRIVENAGTHEELNGRGGGVFKLSFQC